MKILMRQVLTRDQLTQLGLNFIIFAKTYPHFFEALFIKFPFKYMKVTQDTILLGV